MNLKKLTDQELNLLVAAYWKDKCEVYPHPRNIKAAAFTCGGLEYPFMPVNRAEDSYHIIKDNRIAVIPYGKTQWMAYHEDGVNITDSKPLKAAMIVFLMLCEQREKSLVVKS